MFAKKIPQIACFFFVSLLGVCGAARSAQVVLADITDNLPSSVMAQRVLVHAYMQLGIEVKILELPNFRTRNLLESQALDGVVYRLAESPIFDLIKIPVPISFEDFTVFSVNQHFKVRGYKSLQPYSIGHLTGARVLEDRLSGFRVDTAPNTESLFKKLAAGRTDTVIESRYSLCRARELGLNNIVMLEPSLEKILGYHWLSKRREELIPRVSAVLKKMQRDGSIQKIQEQVLKETRLACAN